MLCLQLVDQRVQLVLMLDADEPVLDVGTRMLGDEVLVTPGVTGVALREAVDLTLEGGREQERLARPRGQLQDPLDVRAKAHVEHPVGLVEDGDLDVVERQRPALEQVEQASGCGDEEVRPARALDLWLDADAAEHGQRLEVASLGQRPSLGDDLCGELAGGRQHQRRWTPPGGIDPIDDRSGERQRLARPGGRLGQDVVACEDVGDDQALDRKRLSDPLLGECARDRARDAEIGKRVRHVCVLLSRPAAAGQFGRFDSTRTATERNKD